MSTAPDHNGASGQSSRKSASKRITILLIGVIVLYSLAYFAYWYALRHFHPTSAEAGQFGDMFGGFSAFINGLALLAVAYTVSQQVRQLQVQITALNLQSSAHIVSTLDIFHRRWFDHAMLLARHRACERVLANQGGFAESQSMQHIAENFETMGTLVQLQAIDPHIIWNLYSWYIECYWAMFQTGIAEMRQELKDKSAFTEFERLAESMRAISQEKNVPVFEKSREEIEEFASADKKLAERLLASEQEKATFKKTADI